MIPIIEQMKENWEPIRPGEGDKGFDSVKSNDILKEDKPME